MREGFYEGVVVTRGFGGIWGDILNFILIRNKGMDLALIQHMKRLGTLFSSGSRSRSL